MVPSNVEYLFFGIDLLKNRPFATHDNVYLLFLFRVCWRITWRMLFVFFNLRQRRHWRLVWIQKPEWLIRPYCLFLIFLLINDLNILILWAFFSILNRNMVKYLWPVIKKIYWGLGIFQNGSQSQWDGRDHIFSEHYWICFWHQRLPVIIKKGNNTYFFLKLYLCLILDRLSSMS